MSEVKNPKDMAATTRPNLSLVPDTMKLYAAMAFTEGSLKYGQYNWRVAPVSMTVYLSALERHLIKLRNGEWADEKTSVPHLASILASAAIIIDADICGTLIDDRPPATELASTLSAIEHTIGHLQEIFVGYSPTQWTEAMVIAANSAARDPEPVEDKMCL